MAETSIEKIARAYFENEKVVSHYFHTSPRIGLWKSEETLLCRLFSQSDHLLDIGCGTGRIAFGLESLGFTRVVAADFSSGMVASGSIIAKNLQSQVSFHEADARDLPWEGDCFDGVIFGFNGLFMIPGAKDRLKAMEEIHRVLKPGGRFVFTGHDRNLANQEAHWSLEKASWSQGKQDTRKSDFGDVIEETDLGLMYIHSTDQEEAETLLKTVGFSSIESWLRRELANESYLVREFSDECRFWLAVKSGIKPKG